MSPKRYISLAVLFIICCGIFAVRLFFYQVAVRDTYAAPVISDGNVRTVRVQAQRGNICDRSGNIIVQNAFTYDIQIEYGALPEVRSDAYASYLGILDLMELTGTARADDLSPFEGSYPDYTFLPSALDPNSKIHAKLIKVLKLYFVGSKSYATAEEAAGKVTATELGAYIAENFDIVKKKDGVASSDYSATDIDRLIKLRYNLAATDFGVYNSYVLAENVGERFVSAVKERHLDGITVRANAVRVSNYMKADGSRYAGAVIGTVGVITAETADYYTANGYRMDAMVGRSGCEYAFEEYLRGKDGELAIVQDDRGRIIDTYWITEPTPGRDVWLTIDINMQIAAENALAEKLTDDNDGAVAATDPNTGEVLVLASLPYGEMNHALTAYEPGSTFKVGVALAALNEGIISRYSSIQTLGIYKGMKCSHYVHDGECCGNIGVVKALERSCNYFFAYLGDNLGIDKLSEYARLYGFDASTGLEIGLNATVGEETGILSDDPDLDYMAAIGQLSTCTPLQLSQYISMIANGGTRYSAHLLKSVKNFKTGETVYEKLPSVAATLDSVSAENIETVRQGMYAVVYGSDASSYVYDAFRNAPYAVGGKTGTAEVSGQTDNALFVAFAPFDNPKITVTCFIQQGVTGGLASSVARTVIDSYSLHVSPLASAAG